MHRCALGGCAVVLQLWVGKDDESEGEEVAMLGSTQVRLSLRRQCRLPSLTSRMLADCLPFACDGNPNGSSNGSSSIYLQGELRSSSVCSAAWHILKNPLYIAVHLQGERLRQEDADALLICAFCYCRCTNLWPTALYICRASG